MTTLNSEAESCYGRTVAGTPCELPPGHYPMTKHCITYEGTSWMAWADEAMLAFSTLRDADASGE